MSEFKGTKGPWIASTGVPVEVIGKKPRGGDYVVARCGGNNRVENGSIMAAAPDLLETVDALIEWIEEHSVKPQEIQELIEAKKVRAKALGQTEPAQ